MILVVKRLGEKDFHGFKASLGLHSEFQVSLDYAEGTVSKMSLDQSLAGHHAPPQSIASTASHPCLFFIYSSDLSAPRQAEEDLLPL